MNNVYLRLAKTNLKNNNPLYIPYSLSGMVTVALLYIMLFLKNNEGLGRIPGAESLQMILSFGSVVIAIFAYIFLFYTNSFISKRRKKEVGIYNILGMEKRHIGRVLAIENTFIAFVAIAGGLILGILFSKLMLMALYRILGFQQTIVFSITWDGIWDTLLAFGVLYTILLAYNLMQVKLAKPIELLKGSNVGEKEPKTKKMMTIAGVVFIGIGYYIALTVQNPMEVIPLFFVAVILVIAGTYYLFTAGSIALLKTLRKNKKYYYNKKHFAAVSGLLYRMKQNAAGLASICVLSTMVLVMFSTTVSMFAGVNDILSYRYPSDLNLSMQCRQVSNLPEDVEGQVINRIRESGKDIKEEKVFSFFYMFMTEDTDGTVYNASNERTLKDNMSCIFVYTKENLLAMDKTIDENDIPDIAKGSVVLFGDPYKGKDITLLGETYSVVKSEEYLDKGDPLLAPFFKNNLYVVVDSWETEQYLYEKQRTLCPDAGFLYQWKMGVDLEGTTQEKLDCAGEINAFLASLGSDECETYVESRQANEKEFYTIYGGLFFLGTFLGCIFLMVTVMIIFYKQISEGYDDKERFEIMEKVGMSKEEVKVSIRSQIRIVFFLPIMTAAVHVAAAFPMICRVLLIMKLTNTKLFVLCLLFTFVVFFVIYYVIFKLTSRVYYKIVGN